MPFTIDCDKQVQPCLVAPAASPRAEDASIDNRPVQLPPALREVPLTAEGAQLMRRLLDDPKQPGAEGREMPTADASVLLRKAR